MATKKPAHKIRFGRISAAVWENETKNAVMYNVTVERTYSDGDKLRNSSSFGRDDIPLVIKALDQAHTWIFEQARRPAQGDVAEEAA